MNDSHNARIVTSPQGTTLVLSAFNSTSGSNYTNTFFVKTTAPNITTGNAPFTGNWLPQGGSLNIFDYENMDGTWTITVVEVIYLI